MYDIPEELRWLLPPSTEEVTGAHKSPPKGYPTDRSQYADPENYKYPIDAAHIHAAVSYYNKEGEREKGGYGESQWAHIGHRIAAAANKLIGPGHKLVGGKIERDEKANQSAAKEEGKDAPPPASTPLGAPLGTPQGTPLDDVLPVEATVVTEETVINGEPCFEYESMLIPGDAVSRNTVPGRKGPTYYSARRVRQYANENNALLRAMEEQGHKVTVYPRHAAALLDASLPIGWIAGYDVRPSTTRAGLEDVWYRAVVPLTTEGRDLRAKMRTGLVKYSSLRTFEGDGFTTQPVKLNGKVVEEATRLNIAGVDLVATQPGLPVTPIRLLEEATAIEPWDSPSTPSGDEPSAPATEESMNKHNCPQCKADITDHVHSQVKAHGGDPDSDGKGKSAREELDALTARYAALEEENRTLKAQVEQAAVTEAKVTALEEEIKTFATVREQMQAIQFEREKAAKVEQLLTEDTTLTTPAARDMMRKILVEDASFKTAGDLSAVELLYWKKRADNATRLAAVRPASIVSGYGVVHPAGATEETSSTPARSSIDTDLRKQMQENFARVLGR